MWKTICFLLAYLGASGIALGAIAATENPVVPRAKLGDLRHGTYPSRGIGNLTHVGVDLVADCGRFVYAFADGEVADVIDRESDQNWRDLGYMVLLKHPASLIGKTFYTLYLHLREAPLVNVGAIARAGETRIGRVGNTGRTVSCHTHFEVRYFPDRFYPEWGNIYGKGDKRQSAALKGEWEDPEALFAEFPQGLRVAAESAEPHESGSNGADIQKIPINTSPVDKSISELLDDGYEVVGFSMFLTAAIFVVAKKGHYIICSISFEKEGGDMQLFSECNAIN